MKLYVGCMVYDKKLEEEGRVRTIYIDRKLIVICFVNGYSKVRKFNEVVMRG